jgi:riboflavin kinase/FMN adenylyltransferase
MDTDPLTETIENCQSPWAGLGLPGPSALALGLFDGVHVGHQEILRRTLVAAEGLGVASGVFSFQNHPRSVVANGTGEAPRLLVPASRRVELILDSGIEAVLIPQFTLDWAETPAEVFAREFLSEVLDARHVVVGFNYCFGRRAEGRVLQLEEFGKRYGFSVEVVPPFHLDGIEVSSTRIRNAIQEGRLDEAKRLLGRPHELSGKVVAGDGRGKSLGYPTANLLPDLPPILPLGVYAVTVHQVTEEGANWLGHGMFFIGPRKTFKEGPDVTAEVHILDYQGDLYGQSLRLGILGKVREPMKFSGPEDLIRQLEKDRETCARYY